MTRRSVCTEPDHSEPRLTVVDALVHAIKNACKELGLPEPVELRLSGGTAPSAEVNAQLALTIPAGRQRLAAECAVLVAWPLARAALCLWHPSRDFGRADLSTNCKAVDSEQEKENEKNRLGYRPPPLTAARARSEKPLCALCGESPWRCVGLPKEREGGINK